MRYIYEHNMRTYIYVTLYLKFCKFFTASYYNGKHPVLNYKADMCVVCVLFCGVVQKLKPPVGTELSVIWNVPDWVLLSGAMSVTSSSCKQTAVIVSSHINLSSSSLRYCDFRHL